MIKSSLFVLSLVIIFPIPAQQGMDQQSDKNSFLILPSDVRMYIADIIAERVRTAAARGKTQQELSRALRDYMAFYATNSVCR